MIKRILIPDILQPVSHYCHAVEANGIIWASGLVGMNFDGTIPDNTKDQFDIAMKDLDTCLIVYLNSVHSEKVSFEEEFILGVLFPATR